MAATIFDDALRRLLMHEGGYSNHPSDPGGPTKFGITIHDYRKYVKLDATADDVRAMPLADAKAIYREKYWDALRCDDLPAGLDYAVFDYGVNSGITRAAKVLQRLLGLPDNGRMSDSVIAAATARDAADLVALLCDERLAFLKRLRTWPVFGAGWSRRVAEVRRAALAMANGAEDSGAVSQAQGRGEVPLRKTVRRVTTGAIAVVGGAAANAVHQAGAAWPFVIACVVAAAIMAMAGWMFWRWWQKRSQQAPTDMAQNPLPRLRETLKGWKTVVFGVLVTGAGIAAEILDALQAIDLAPLLPPAYAVKIIAIIGVVTIVLRFATTGRVGRKDV
jgi:lysozyme family protein